MSVAARDTAPGAGVRETDMSDRHSRCDLTKQCCFVLPPGTMRDDAVSSPEHFAGYVIIQSSLASPYLSPSCLQSAGCRHDAAWCALRVLPDRLPPGSRRGSPAHGLSRTHPSQGRR